MRNTLFTGNVPPIQRQSGCERCSFGIRRKPDTPRLPAALVIVRALQFRRSVIEFCDCASGRAYKAHIQGICDDIASGREYLASTTIIRIDEWIDENPLMPTPTGS